MIWKGKGNFDLIKETSSNNYWDKAYLVILGCYDKTKYQNKYRDSLMNNVQRIRDLGTLSLKWEVLINLFFLQDSWNPVEKGAERLYYP
jgi:NADPH-dependent 7-cyano-7-deazaguanine reductase QueF-like protein